MSSLGSEANLELEVGTLWQAALERTVLAREVGALQTIATDLHVVEDGGCSFAIRIARDPVVKKPNRVARLAAGRPPGDNPFLPFAQAMFVANVSTTHVCLLNRFNVIPHHLLMVTRVFEEQTSRLNLADFSALCVGLREIDGLAFYNGGAAAGASQPHKHLQLVPLPLAAGSDRMPAESLIESALRDGLVGSSSALPFAHAVARIEDLLAGPVETAAERLLGCYLELRDRLGLARRQEPFNLLVTRAWMLLVPRVLESFESIGINGLAYAGSFFLPRPQLLETLKRIGALEILRAVGVPTRSESRAQVP